MTYKDQMRRAEVDENTKNYAVYINGQEVDRELINLEDYRNVSIDDENERLIITVN